MATKMFKTLYLTLLENQSDKIADLMFFFFCLTSSGLTGNCGVVFTEFENNSNKNTSTSKYFYIMMLGNCVQRKVIEMLKRSNQVTETQKFKFI